MSETIYLIAPSGHPNYGDELILLAWLRHLARVRPDAAVVVDCHTPGQASVLVAGAHPNVTFVDTVWRICFATADLPAAEAVAAAAAAVHEPGRLPNLVSGIELLARAHVVHLIGGGYLNTVWPHHLALPAAAAAGAERAGARLFATGQGLAPAGDEERRRLLADCAARFDRFDVRDAPSRALLADLPGCSHTGDDAWLVAGTGAVYDTESEASRRDWIFGLQTDLMDDFDDGRGADGLADAAADLITRWGLRGADIAFVEGIPGTDRRVYDRIAHLVPDALFVPFVDIWNRGLPVRPGQFWVTTRFHLHLLAAARGASGLALTGRRDYYPVKHESLVQAGSHWALADSCALPDRLVRAGGFPSDTVLELRRRKRALDDELYPPPAPRPVARLRGWRERLFG